MSGNRFPLTTFLSSGLRLQGPRGGPAGGRPRAPPGSAAAGPGRVVSPDAADPTSAPGRGGAGRGWRRPSALPAPRPLPSGDSLRGDMAARFWGRCFLRFCRWDLRLFPELQKAAARVTPSNPAPVPCGRRAWPGGGRHYRAARCAELKQPLAVEEVAPRPVGPREVGWPACPRDLLTPVHVPRGHDTPTGGSTLD